MQWCPGHPLSAHHVHCKHAHTPSQAHLCNSATTPLSCKQLWLILQLKLCPRNCQDSRQSIAQLQVRCHTGNISSSTMVQARKEGLTLQPRLQVSWLCWSFAVLVVLTTWVIYTRLLPFPPCAEFPLEWPWSILVLGLTIAFVKNSNCCSQLSTLCAAPWCDRCLLITKTLESPQSL